jgi:hypothetical protein
VLRFEKERVERVTNRKGGAGCRTKGEEEMSAVGSVTWDSVLYPKLMGGWHSTGGGI